MQDSDPRDGQDPRTALQATGGRDELNLAEFPITRTLGRARWVSSRSPILLANTWEQSIGRNMGKPGVLVTGFSPTFEDQAAFASRIDSYWG
jgi:hypothetical protein